MLTGAGSHSMTQAPSTALQPPLHQLSGPLCGPPRESCWAGGWGVLSVSWGIQEGALGGSVKGKQGGETDLASPVHP